MQARNAQGLRGNAWLTALALATLNQRSLGMLKEGGVRYNERQPMFPGSSCFPLSAESSRTYKDQLDQLNVIFSVIGKCPPPPTSSQIGGCGSLAP